MTVIENITKLLMNRLYMMNDFLDQLYKNLYDVFTCLMTSADLSCYPLTGNDI